MIVQLYFRGCSLLQYLVFVCDLTVAELADLESAVTEVMALHEDSVIQIDHSPLHAVAAIRTLGRPRRLPTTGSQIV